MTTQVPMGARHVSRILSVHFRPYVTDWPCGRKDAYGLCQDVCPYSHLLVMLMLME